MLGIPAPGKDLGLSTPGFSKEISCVLYARKSGSRKGLGAKHAWFDYYLRWHGLCLEYGLGQRAWR